ncbi:MAG: DMT family transporter [Pseudoruegeria sp.]
MGAGSNVIGSLWMIGAMAAFAVEDTLLKAVSQGMPVAQMLILFGLGGAGVFSAVILVRGEHLFPKEVLSKAMGIRAVFEVLGRLFYILALALTPLSATTVILQATPIVVVGAAAVLFAEPVGWRRWTAIAIGLSGVLIILRPGAEGFTPLSILAVLGMLGFAGRDLASRVAPAALSALILGLYGFLAVILSGALYAFWEAAPFVWPDRNTAAGLIVAVGVGVVAYSCLMKAMRTGEVSAVTPFRYSRLLFGIGLGVLVFDETLTAPMFFGSCLIVTSGLFILVRGRSHQGRPNN